MSQNVPSGEIERSMPQGGTLDPGDRADAEDATSDAFVAAWKHWSSLRDPARPEAWFG